MSARLLSLTAAAPLLGCRDPRTARKRLAELGVPVLKVGRRVLVDPREIARAVKARQGPLDPWRGVSRPGVTLRPGERLWDGPGTTHGVGRSGGGRRLPERRR